jgi:hypothetical protein
MLQKLRVAVNLMIMQPRPVTNLDEPIGKIVGRRRPPANPLQVAHSNREAAVAWMKALPARMPPRGVYRFKSHEEADLWMKKHTGPKIL